jgi:2,4-dienoyl-CoA reductase (NADPH2)
MANSNFEKLLSPGLIGRVITKNRIIKTAQGSSVIEPDTGFVGGRALAYYENLIKGGVGLMIVESCGVEYPLGTHHAPVQFRLHDDNLIPSFHRLTDMSHKYNCPIFIQLIHSGPWNPTGKRNVSQARCSSTLTRKELPGTDFVETRGMTLEEIAQVQEMFIQAAERAYKAGFDGVEINAATCTLPNSFISRVFNKRSDRYGASSLENRTRFVTEIISGIRQRLDPGFAVTVIVNIAEYNHPLATPIEEGVQIAKIMQDAGAQAIQVRGHAYGDRAGLMHPDRYFFPELPENPPKDLDWSNRGKGAILPYATAIKKAGITVPVISAVRLDPILGEKALRAGQIDFVGMTRRLLADPDLPNKVMENRLEDIRPCLGCLYCMDVRLQNKYVMCRVNPRINREREIVYEAAAEKKRVLVIGAGPSGLEAARVAALRGHEVHLYDKQSRLGGLIPLAALLKDIEVDELTDLIKWFGIQLDKLGVHICLGTEADDRVIDQIKPDVIILAAGGKHSLPEIAGMTPAGLASAGVTTSGDLHRQMKKLLKFFSPQTMAKLTRIWMPVGKKVVVIGSRIHGCETAEFLVKRGRQVTLVDTADNLGEGMTVDDKSLLFPWFDKKGVKRYLGVKLEKISKGSLELITPEGQKITLRADSLMTALPLSPNKETMDYFRGKAAEVFFVGDCCDPKLIAEATAAGALAAMKIGNKTGHPDANNKSTGLGGRIPLKTISVKKKVVKP